MRIGIAALMACCLILGCSHEEPGGIVRGKVTYNGKALDKGTVVFQPTGSGGQLCTGTVQKDGTFQLINQSKTERIPLGEYIAVVFADNTEIAAMKEDPSYPVQPSVPFRFSSVTTSPMKYEVKLGENEIDMNLDNFK